MSHALLAFARLSVQPEALHTAGQQPGGQPHFVFSQAQGGEGGLNGGAGRGLPSGVAKIDHAVEQVFEAGDESVQQYLCILDLQHFSSGKNNNWSLAHTSQFDSNTSALHLSEPENQQSAG